MEEQGRCTDIAVQSLLVSYEQVYKNQDISLQMWMNESYIYPKFPKYQNKSLKNDTEGKIVIKTENSIKVIYVTAKLRGMTNPYSFMYERPLTELNEIWNSLNHIYISLSIGISALLAILLGLVLYRIMQPLKKLSMAVNEMREGNYESRVEPMGNDEISELGINFNHMAIKIQQDVRSISAEAERKQMFIDNLAHELKSPLTSIYGFAEYIQKANVSDSEREECLSFIMEESKRMMEMSYTLLDLAMYRKEQIEYGDISINTLKETVNKILESRLKDKSVTLKWDYHIEKIYGNGLLIESLLTNLISNAVSACRQKGKIIVQLKAGQARMIHFEVIDNGKGICQEDLLHIMEPFYRVDKSRSREHGETGLGLALCKKIVEAHHGDISYTSEQGKGTCVKIDLWKSFTD
ncbi:HAMP domain-containing sensor histidine kinase [Anaerocolumna sp. AGMB13020]|uniref:sensor histidine kinase n=1 Tax=Anaerocolumna sp. AGMB13020 TaxID=3081750 RepID=UPI0029541822|nr:HAMP domain-containing sensor histidine kinase [Anaerocolumna sp. AGMB13020]WOO36080.1 HAMP domain-containing sensor histidine kinase [Anaerocolumna sp. AGMB13020]